MVLKKIIKKILFAIIILLVLFGGIFLADKLLNVLKDNYKSDNQDRTSFFRLFNKEDEKNENSDDKSFINSIFSMPYSNTGTNPEQEQTSNTSSEKIVIDADYDPFYFDDNLLLYEGKQNGNMVRSMINRLIDNTNQELFSYVDVTIKNFGSLDGKISFTNKEDYVSRLMSVRNSIEDNGKYNISYGYSKYKTHVNEVIIEKY